MCWFIAEAESTCSGFVYRTSATQTETARAEALLFARRPRVTETRTTETELIGTFGTLRCVALLPKIGVAARQRRRARGL